MKPLLLSAAVLTAIATPAGAQTTLPVTSDVGHFAKSNHTTISDDGRYVAYESPGSNAPTDTCVDIHVRDLLTGSVTAITACDSSTGGVAWPSSSPALSGDGSRVAYVRLAGSPPIYSVIVAEVTGVGTSIASVNDQGLPANSACYYPAVSTDGSRVAFHTTATNLETPPVPVINVYNVYVRDSVLATTALISASITGGGSIDGHSQYPSISGDGRYVAFESLAEDLIAPGLDTNNTQDIYVRDRDPDGNGVLDESNATTILITRNAAGIAVASGGQKAAISTDGRFVAFLSISSELAGVSGNKLQVHVCDRDPDGNGDFTDTPPSFEVASRSSLGSFGNGECYYPSISGDGRLVAFSTWSNNLVPNDFGNPDAFVFDRWTEQITRVSVDSYGTAGDGPSLGGWTSDDPAISADGSRVAFSSRATNLVPGDVNGFEDVFAHDFCPPVGIDLGFALAGTGGLEPVLTTCGDLSSGGTGLMRLRDALPGAPAWIVLGATAAPLPLFGGSLVPSPPIVVAPIPTDGLGGLTLGISGGGGPFDLYVQIGVLDFGAPAGLAFSNASRLEFLP